MPKKNSSNINMVLQNLGLNVNDEGSDVGDYAHIPANNQHYYSDLESTNYLPQGKNIFKKFS